MKGCLEKYQKLKNCNDLTSEEQQKLDERINFFKKDTKRLTNNLKKLEKKDSKIDKNQMEKFNDHYKKCKKDFENYETKSSDNLDIRAIQRRNNLPVDDDTPSPKKSSKAKIAKIATQNTYNRQRSDYLVVSADSVKSKGLCCGNY